VAEDTGYVEPLSGEEVVIDLCSQIADKLRQNCDLRPVDAYGGGYAAQVSIRVQAFGMDTAEIVTEVNVGKLKENLDPEKDREVKTIVDVPVEPALDHVRQRSEQQVPTLTTEEGRPTIKQRRYLRKGSVPQGGGATGEEL